MMAEFQRLGGWVVAAILLSVTSGCSKSEKDAEPVVNVQVATVKESSITRVINCEAVLFPLQQAAITAKVSAPVRRFYVNRGSRVKAGQLVASLENRDLAASAVENKGALAQAQAAYATTTASSLPEAVRKAELDVEDAKQAFDAEQKLFDSRQSLYQQGALPRKDLDQARVSLTQAKSQFELAQQHLNALQAGGKQQELKSASGQLQSAEGKYQGAQAQLSYSEIRSPIHGIVTDRALYPGEMATAGTPLLVVMDTSSVIAKAHIPQEDAALLKVGTAAELIIPGNENNIPARITVVSPATDPNSTTIEVWAQATNSGAVLRPGTTAKLSIAAQKIDGALVIPFSAVLKQPDGSSAVMVAGPDNRAHLQAIQLGIQNGDDVQIVSGLKARQQVVTDGGYGLPDNTQIKIDSSPSATTKSD
jgi:HlyD family secretion protein